MENAVRHWYPSRYVGTTENLCLLSALDKLFKANVYCDSQQYKKQLFLIM